MTQIIICVSPGVLLGAIYLAKFCIDRFSRYKELKLLRDSGVTHAVIAKDHIYFE